MMVAVTVGAADSQNVTATVTVQSISVSVADGNVSYGILAANASKDTTNSGVDETQTATNDGNVTEVLNIRGDDTNDWALSGANGTDLYVHKFCITTCDSSPTWTALTTSNQTLNASVAVNGTQDFDLQITTPDPSTVFTQQSAVVTVQATL